MTIFVHALEGEPENLSNFNEKTERDIRVKHLVTDEKGNPGPWKLKQNGSPAGKIILVPSDVSLIRGNITEVHLPFIADGADLTRRLLLDYQKPDHVDFAPSLTDTKNFDYLRKQRKKVRVLTMPGLSLFYLGFILAPKKFFFEHENKRKGVVSAIDVHKHASLGEGAADPAVGPVPPCLHGYEPNCQQASFDLDQAKLLLKGSPFPKADPPVFVFNNKSTYTLELANEIIEDLKRADQAVKPDPVGTWREVLSKVRHQECDMFLYSWHQREPREKDPYEFLTALFHSRNIGTTNLTGYSNPTVDSLLDGPDPDHKAAQIRIIKDAPMVCLSHWKRHAAYNVRVSNLQLGPGALPVDRLVDVDVDPNK